MSRLQQSVLQLLASAVLLVVVYIVATPTRLPRSALLSYPEQPAAGGRIRRHDSFSAQQAREFDEMPRQDNGEVDVDVSDAPMQEQVSNMDITVAVARPRSPQRRVAAAPAGGLTGHHTVVDGVSASWARKPAGASALAQQPARTQQLSAAYLEAQGINTGEEWNHVLDHRVQLGGSNPSVFFAAGRQAPDLQPNPSATAHPARPANKLTHRGVYTGTEQTQWDDNMISSAGMEEPYNFGASPTREWDSPSRRAGTWGIFKPKMGSTAMLAQTAKDDLSQVQLAQEQLAEESDAEESGGVKVDSFPEMDTTVPDHMKINMDPRGAWVKPPPSNGNLKGVGVNTGEEHHDFGDVHVSTGKVSPVHVGTQHHLAEVGVNVGDETIIHADEGAHVYVPDTVATAKPRKTKQHKLDKLGVNTGDEHTQWGDSMVEHAEGLEPSYNVGISPNREYTTATPFPGTSNWPAKGSRGDKVGQKLSAAAAASSAHDFFKNAVLPKAHAAAHAAQHAAKSKESEQLHQKASVAAQPYVREADRAKQRASKTAQELKRDLGKAVTAEKLAGVARQQAVRVGEAEAQVDKAQHKLSEEKKVFLSNMAQVKTEMPKAHKQEHKSATARQQKAQTQAHLDADTEKDMKENKALAAPSDLDGFFGTVNANSHDRTNAYREPHAPAVEPNEAGPLAKIVTGKKKAAAQPVLHAEKTVEHKAKKHEQHAQKKKAVAQQVLHAKPKRSNNKRSKATAAAHHKALREAQHAPKGIVIQDKDLCAISVWGVHPLCPDAYTVKQAEKPRV